MSPSRNAWLLTPTALNHASARACALIKSVMSSTLRLEGLQCLPMRMSPRPPLRHPIAPSGHRTSRRRHAAACTPLTLRFQPFNLFTQEIQGSLSPRRIFPTSIHLRATSTRCASQLCSCKQKGHSSVPPLFVFSVRPRRWKSSALLFLLFFPPVGRQCCHWRTVKWRSS